MAAELRAVGVDMSFAPCVDLDYGVSCVIGDRAFHRDPRVVAELAIAFMGGMREAGMAATAKHFPGHGAVAPDSHVAMPVDRRPLADLEDDLYPYRRLIDNGLASVMAAHVVFAEVDDCPAGFSRRWMQGRAAGSAGFRRGRSSPTTCPWPGPASSATCRRGRRRPWRPAATCFPSATIAKVCSKSSILYGGAVIL